MSISSHFFQIAFPVDLTLELTKFLLAVDLDEETQS